MEAGTISKWNVAEGEAFAAGDSLAVIETDKATIDFEAQDDGVVGKLLKEAGSGEVAVGVPIMVTVEEESDVAAFKNFVAGSAPDSSATEASVPPPVEEVKAPEPVAAAAPTPAAASPAPTPAAAVAPAVETAPSPVAGAVSVGGFSWGQLAAESSPLARTLASKQKEYIEKYGSTGHVPLV
jgi:pyruvate dehydrogenase E2 component (dihydrolipoamide acetyltransferase)